ncbi:MAG TPA: alkaline phosphatase family protein [Bryobacteraceae bacterium]|nr:alkaline phosphatase family protein [Bryobacteraceae bacterium]
MRFWFWMIFACAVCAADRPHWERVQHFVFVLLPEASFDSLFGAFPDAEGVPGERGAQEVPNLWAYGDLYTVQDHFFSSSDPVEMLRAETARWDAAGLGWKAYGADLEAFRADVESDILPAVSLLIPDQVDGVGMEFVTRVVNGVAGSRLWRRSAVFVAWKGPGGFADHVAAPKGMGGRVPSLVISPWTRVGYNDHRVYTHASWVRSIENRFGLQPGDGAVPDLAVPDLYDAFDFAQQPREAVMLDPSGSTGYPVTEQGQVFPAAGWLDNVHACHGTWTVAAGSAVLGYGSGFVLEEEAGTAPSLSRVVVTDSQGIAREARAFYTGPTQVNYVVPEETAAGLAQVRIDTARMRFDGFLLVETVSPGLFSTTRQGQGPADAEAVSDEGASPTFICGETGCRSRALSGRTVLLRATGLRGAKVVRAWMDGSEVRVRRFAPDTETAGLDRVEVELPREKTGPVLVMVEADGVLSNAVQLLLGAAL